MLDEDGAAVRVPAVPVAPAGLIMFLTRMSFTFASWTHSINPRALTMNNG